MASAIAAKGGLVKGVAAMETANATANAVIPTDLMEIAWKQATVRPVTPTATTIMEIASTQRQAAARVTRIPRARIAVAANGLQTDPVDNRGLSAVTASSAEVDVVVVGVDVAAEVGARARAQSLPTETSQAVARARRGPAPRWACR